MSLAPHARIPSRLAAALLSLAAAAHGAGAAAQPAGGAASGAAPQTPAASTAPAAPASAAPASAAPAPAAPAPAAPASAPTSPAAAPQAPAGPLLGIKLGTPLAAQRCAAGAADTPPPAGKRCYVEETYRGEKRLRLNLPEGELPGWANAARVVLDAAGKVETLRVHTTGIRVQRPVMLTLIRHYGKPTRTSAVKVTDSKGMTLESLLAIWETPDAMIEYQSMTGETDDGLVTIRTPRAAGAQSTGR